ncbi:MAG: hypothetical protein GY842_25825 [bacterium]|nr:hypothetical protein [bacterium]
MKKAVQTTHSGAQEMWMVPAESLSTRWRWRALWLTCCRGYKTIWVAQDVEVGWFGRLRYHTTWVLEQPAAGEKSLTRREE